MKFKFLPIIAVILIMTCAAYASEESPYLYYYSRLLGGVIIERADSTDSRQIATDSIPAGLNDIGGAGWSSSGQYFAVHYATTNLYGLSIREAKVIDSSGADVPSLLGIIVDPNFMQWSPDADILLVAGVDGRSRSFYGLFDITTGNLLADYGAMGSLNRGDIIWDMVNKQVSFTIMPELYLRQAFQVTLKFDGTVLREPLSLDVDTPLRETTDEFDLSNGDMMSPSGRYTASGFAPTILTDTETGQQVELSTHSQATWCRDYRWTEDEQNILIRTGTVAAGGGCGLSVLAVTDRHGQLWRELGYCSWASTCVDWLPEQVDPLLLPVGQTHPVQLDPIAIELSDDILYGVPQETMHLRLYCHNDTFASITDDNTGETLYELTIEDCPYPQNYNEADSGMPIIAAYNPEYDLLVTYYSYNANGIDVWMKQGKRFQPLIKLNTDGYQLGFSEDNNVLRARNRRGWKMYSVQDILARGKINNP